VYQSCVISVVLVIVLSLTGCGNHTELNGIGITTATGVDGKEGDWTITYQVVNPSAMSSSAGGGAGGASQSAVHTFSTHANTIREAVDMSNLENARKLYFAHNDLIIIGKRAAEEGIAEVIDIYLRSSESRETVKLLIADGEASEYLKMLVPPGKLPGQSLSQILKESNQTSSFFPSKSIFEFALEISSDSGAVGIPEVSLKGNDSSKLESIDIFKETSSKAKLKLSTLSVFKADKRIGKLNQLESLGVSWLNNKVNSTTFSFEDKGSDKRLSTFRVRNAKVKVTPVKGPLHYSLNVKANVAGELVESTSQEPIDKSEGINNMQQQVEKVIESQILAGWNSIQKLNIDLIGIANIIHRKHPKDWKNIKESWSEEFADMDINIEVKVVIKRPGLFQKSFSNILGKEKKK
jgi:spore germination protein KC